mgnify:FL=1
MRLDDLREQFEKEKTDFEIRKKRALDIDSTTIASNFVHKYSRFLSFFNLDRPQAVSLPSDQISPLPSSSTYDFLPNNLAPAMSEADYNDLFHSDPITDEPIRSTDETQLAINSIVDCGMMDSGVTTNTIDMSDPANFFFDDLDINNPAQDDEASRAVQNLLGFS